MMRICNRRKILIVAVAAILILSPLVAYLFLTSATDSTPRSPASFTDHEAGIAFIGDPVIQYNPERGVMSFDIRVVNNGNLFDEATIVCWVFDTQGSHSEVRVNVGLTPGEVSDYHIEVNCEYKSDSGYGIEIES